MKAQMKGADRSGASYAVIVGTDELDAGTAVVRPLRSGGDQVVVGRADLLPDLQSRLQKAST
jgi:histidyl-tRNA synthetase